MSNAPTLEIIKPSSSLAGADKKLLVDLEAEVEQGLRGVMEALHKIKNHKNGDLWRSQGFITFEEYCQDRFGFKKQHAYRLAAAGEFVSNLDTGVPLPIRESQVRTLINKLPEPEKRVEFWKQLVENTPPSRLTPLEIESKLTEFIQINTPTSTKKKEPATSRVEQDTKTDRSRQRCHTLIRRLEEACEGLPLEDEILSALKELEKLVKRKRK